MKKEILIFLLLLLISIPAVRSLFMPGGFTSHDLTHHILRQISMDKLLREGQFPPRWSGELNNGYGYPVFLFNYPLPALFGEIFHKLGLNFLYSVKAVLVASMLLSVLGMYLFLRAYLGNKMASFLGAMFYLYAPVRFLNVYVSAAVGSVLAAALVPFVFLSMVRGWVLLGSLFFALLILSHNITTLIFSPLVAAFAAVLALDSPKPFKVLKNIFLMLLFGMLLSAWFWLPALYEKQYIRFDSIFHNFYQSQFVSLYQLVRSPWGYGLSHPQNPEEGDMSYQIGIIHFLVAVFLLFAVFIFKKIRKIGLVILFFFFLSLFLINKASGFLWEFIPLMPMIQFPLRFSAISVFTASIGVGLLIKYLPFKKTMFVAFLILVIYANRNHWTINQVFDPGEDYYLSLKTTTASFDEHLPVWGRRMITGSPGKFEFIKNKSSNIKILTDQSGKVLAAVEATEAGKIRFNQFYFPGWEIKVDGQNTKFDYLNDGESYGMPVFDIDRGSHRIEAEFKNTADRNLADTISLISVIVWLMLLCRLLILR